MFSSIQLISASNFSAVTVSGACVSPRSDLEVKLNSSRVGTTACDGSSWTLTFDATALPEGTLVLSLLDTQSGAELDAVTLVKCTTSLTTVNTNLKLVAPPSTTIPLPSIKGGLPPYTYSIQGGLAAIDANTGDYTAPSQAELTSVQVADSAGNSLTVTVDYAPTTVNGSPNTMAFSGADMFLGGTFNAHRPYFAPGFAMLDKATGAFVNSPCNYFKGLGSDIRVTAANSDSIFISTSRTEYDGQTVQGLIKVSLIDCSLDSTFTQITGFDSAPNVLYLDGADLYVGGGFTTYRGASVKALAKIDITTGNLDSAFHSEIGLTSGNIYAITGDSSHIYVGGYITDYRSNALEGLAKISKVDGALDTTFTQATGFNMGISAVHVSGGFVYAGGGNATTYRGTVHGKLAKLSITDGTLDTTFSQSSGFANGMGGTVSNILSDNNHIYVSGGFTSYRGSGILGLVRLNKTTGAADTTFTSAGAVGSLLTVASADVRMVFDGDNVIVAGGFLAFKGTQVGSLVSISKTTGTLNSGFSSLPGLRRIGGVSVGVSNITDGGSLIFLNGGFDFYGGTYTGSIMKVKESDFSLDPTFNLSTGLNTDVAKLLYLDGNLYIATKKTATYRGSAVSGLLKVSGTTGALDVVFSASNNTNSNVVALETDGTGIYLGGIFSQYRGVAVGRLAKVDTSGVLDSTFSTTTASSSTIHVIKYISGSLYIGGQFSTYKGSTAGRLAKIDASTAALDTTFTTGAGFYAATGGFINSIVAVPGGIAVTGVYSTYRGASVSAPAVLNSTNGSLDGTFNHSSGYMSWTSQMVGYAGGLLLSAGDTVATYAGSSVGHLFKVDHVSGVLDTTFGSLVGTTGPEGSHKIEINGSSGYAIGDFSKVSGKYRPCFARFNPATGAFE